MDYRPLGRTGVQVSNLCLGTMMFGAWGNTDHDDSIRIIHARARRRDQLRRHRRRLLAPASPRRSSARRSRAVATTSCWRRSSSCRWATTPTGAALAALDHDRGRGLAAPPRHRLHRPLPGPPPRPGQSTSRRRSARSPTSSGRARSATSAPRRSPAARSSRRSGRGARARPRALPHRAAAVLAARRAASSSTSCRPRSATAWASSPTARSAAAGCRAAGAPTARRPRPPASGSPRASTCRCPRTSASSKPSSSSQQVADDAGLSMIELAIAFVVNHPGVTSAIIGPRTMEQLESQLPAADVDARRRRCSTASTRSSSPA